MKTWKTLHLEIAGVLVDRDESEFGVELTMKPIGHQLERGQQRRELEIRVASGDPDDEPAVLDEEGIMALAKFLRQRP